jgi:glycine/D-amino acid oxidase-like deaminating enzyme
MSTARTIPVWPPIEDSTRGWFDTRPPHGAQDVVVVGAGVAGLTTALCLLREGRGVLVVDKAGVGAGETRRTSAHRASALDDRYALLARTPA